MSTESSTHPTTPTTDPTPNAQHQKVQLSKEEKKRLKQERKAKAKAEKARKEAEKLRLKMMPYKDKRLLELSKLEDLGLSLYPHKFNSGDFTVISTETYREKYDGLNAGDHLEDKVAIMGRVYSIRSSSKNLFFFDVFDEGHKVQVMANSKAYAGSQTEDSSRTEEEHKERNTLLFRTFTKALKSGDYIGVCGTVCKTKLGELSISPSYMQLLSPCLHQVPRGEKNCATLSALTNTDARFRSRHLDLIVHDRVRDIFVKRSLIIKFIRRYLEDMGLLEVDTPVLDVRAGGATAAPFKTYSNDLSIEMFMRVAPELYLKRLIIGGFNGVFEIGRQFRNESNDLTHNSEFSTCECYIRNFDYNDLMNFNEDMFRNLVKTINGDLVLNLHVRNENGTKDSLDIDFTEKFARIDMVPSLEELMGVKFPDPSTFGTKEARVFFDSLCTEHSVSCSPPRTTARMLDKLCGHFIEPLCVNPTFIYGHPQVMSPLAKPDRNRPGLTERFELFINGLEYSNAYTELNDPAKQMECFIMQDADRKNGDEEAQPVDGDYVKAMEYGLPPTGGWGCGIDRLCMLLCDEDSIREVILFPTMKPEQVVDREKKQDDEDPAEKKVKVVKKKRLLTHEEPHVDEVLHVGMLKELTGKEGEINTGLPASC